MLHLNKYTYVWTDGYVPANLRSKVKVSANEPDLWSLDGSSTRQSNGKNSDVILKPVRVYKNKKSFTGDIFVLAECLDDDGLAAIGNHRKALEEFLIAKQEKMQEIQPLVAFEQEYFIMDPVTKLPCGFGRTKSGEIIYPEPQGNYYCGVGGNYAIGRSIVDRHTDTCIDYGLPINGTNSEVCVSQWEFQLGFHFEDLSSDLSTHILTICDDLWTARYLLSRIAEDEGFYISLHCKPIKCDFGGGFNGSGAHTNFSTKQMRDPGGIKYIHEAVEKLSKTHDEHMKVYGVGLEDRLTGLHETCHISEFKWGVADRTASIRIPRSVEKNGSGFFEDRRPGSNMNPYQVVLRILQTLLE